jgi:hypothetical protein
MSCRALAVRDGVDVIWFWIGSHADYDRLLGTLRQVRFAAGPNHRSAIDRRRVRGECILDI